MARNSSRPVSRVVSKWLAIVGAASTAGSLIALAASQRPWLGWIAFGGMSALALSVWLVSREDRRERDAAQAAVDQLQADVTRLAEDSQHYRHERDHWQRMHAELLQRSLLTQPTNTGNPDAITSIQPSGTLHGSGTLSGTGTFRLPPQQTGPFPLAEDENQGKDEPENPALRDEPWLTAPDSSSCWSVPLDS